MDAVPLLRSLADGRNLHSVAFYVGFILLALFGFRGRASTAKEINGKHVSNGKSVTNGNGYHAPDTEHDTDQMPPKTILNGLPRLHQCPPLTSLPPTENIVLFSLGIMSLPFIPATNLFFYVGFVIAERVLYIPSIGFCLLVATGARTLYIRLRTRGRKALLLCLCMALVLLNGIRTVQRNRDWSNEENLYKSGISANPAKGKRKLPHINMSMYETSVCATIWKQPLI